MFTTKKVKAVLAEHWSDGEGAAKLAENVVRQLIKHHSLKLLYEDNDKPEDKIKKVASEIYRAKDVSFSAQARKIVEISDLDNSFQFYGKKQYSFSTDPSKKCAPVNHDILIREIRLSAGAEFIVAIAGDIIQCSLPRNPRLKCALEKMVI